MRRLSQSLNLLTEPARRDPNRSQTTGDRAVRRGLAASARRGTLVGPAVRAVLTEEFRMGKTGRKRRARRKNKANHGKRPNA
jgi:hypothetical protein